jgi:hypothetical protein
MLYLKPSSLPTPTTKIQMGGAKAIMPHFASLYTKMNTRQTPTKMIPAKASVVNMTVTEMCRDTTFFSGTPS